MRTRFGLVLPPWSFAAAGRDWLDALAGEIGADELVVPAITGPIHSLRLAWPDPTPLFASTGGWHYPADPRAYVAAGLRPARARWFGTTDELARLVEHATRLGLDVVLRAGFRAIPALAETEPHLVAQNAWGQADATGGLCVSQPQVRELLRAVLADLARFGPGRVEIAGWELDAGPGPLRWHPVARRVMTTCFCPACRQIAERAGVAADALAQAVRTNLAAIVAGTADPVALERELAAYGAVRRADAGSWLERVVSEAGCKAAFEVVEPGRGGELGGVPRYWRAQFGPGDEAAAPDGMAGWTLAAGRPAVESGAALVRRTQTAVAAGVGWISYEGVDEAPSDGSTWIKQAVRYGRRLAADGV